VCESNVLVKTKHRKVPGEHPSPLTLEAGSGFESRSRSFRVGDFIIVDAWLPVGLRAPFHLHERSYFTLILRGGFTEHYGAQALTAAAGTMNFVPSGTPHWTQSQGARIVRLELPDRALALAREVGPILQRPAVFAEGASVALARRVAAEVRTREKGWPLVVDGLLMELLGHVVRDQSALETVSIPRWLREVKQRLDTEWASPVSLDELALVARVHPVHLARAFRASYGSSVGEYRRQRQIEAAEQRLARSDEDLCEVALGCGFADQSHFSKAFRRAFGISPGRYRRAHATTRGR
jgi:AraC family transcriptional regulator